MRISAKILKVDIYIISSWSNALDIVQPFFLMLVGMRMDEYLQKQEIV